MDSSMSFAMESVVEGAMRQVDEAISAGVGKATVAIFGFIMIFHVIVAGMEIVTNPRSCRFFRAEFIFRILLIGGILVGYRMIFLGSMTRFFPGYMSGFATSWVGAWVTESDALDNTRTVQKENEAIKYAEVTSTKAGKDDDSWFAKVARFGADGVVTGIAHAVTGLLGCLITALVLMEGFWALGATLLILAIGPICVACGAHEKTEGIFWSFLKAFAVFGLFYMPMLGIACRFAGVVIAQVTTMAVGMEFGDGTDVAVHFLMVVIGPFCAFAVVRAAPMVMGMLFGVMHGTGGAGGAWNGIFAAAGTALRVLGGSSGGRGGGAEKQGGGDAGGGPMGGAPKDVLGASGGFAGDFGVNGGAS